MPKGVGKRLLIASMVLSIILFVLLGAVYLEIRSELALAQAADSLADVLTAGVLLFALDVSQRPPDDGHPFGHQAAQPVAALIVAVLIGVMAVEVLLSAIDTLRSGAGVRPGWPVAAVLGLKVVIKVVLLRLARRAEKNAASAMQAFATDARSDALLGTLSIIGAVVAYQAGWQTLDAWLAIPIALWIFGAGMMLGWENIRLLMGAAVPDERQEELKVCAAKVAGVQRVGRLRARHHGTEVAVWVEIFVNRELSIGHAHDVGEAVEDVLETEADVAHATVHVDAER